MSIATYMYMYHVSYYISHVDRVLELAKHCQSEKPWGGGAFDFSPRGERG